MELKINFHIPEHIYIGILKGDYIRTGGVIQHAKDKSNAGKIVAWMREISVEPIPSNSLLKDKSLNNALNMVGSVSSLLNLGATVCFGINILNKLGTIEQKIDNLQWTVNVGFASVLKQLNRLTEYHETEIVANLKSAAKLAWTAQLLEPDSPNRINRIEMSLATIIKTTERLLMLVKNSGDKTIQFFLSKSSGRKRLDIDDDVLLSLNRFRQTVLALSLQAAIHAEAGDLKFCLSDLEKSYNELQNLLFRLGNAFIRSTSKNGIVYDDLLNKQWKGVISPQRIDLWSKRFDPEIKGIYEIIEMLRSWNGHALTPLAKEITWEPQVIKNFPVFADLLDGAYEDLERFKGHLIEYQNALSMNLPIHEYRKMIEIKEIQEGKKLAFFTEQST